MRKKIQSFCRVIINDKNFAIFIFALIIISLGIIMLEAIMPVARTKILHYLNDVLLVIFGIELVMRWIAVGRFRDFIKEYWIDALAVLAMYPFFRLFRVFRLLRMISLVVFLRRHMRAFFHFFRKQLLEYMLVFGLIIFIIVFSAISLDYMEFKEAGGEATMERSFWITIFSLFAGSYVTEFPKTIGGRIVLVMTTFTGVSLFAILSGTVSAFMIQRLKEGAYMGKFSFLDMEDHVIICGWNDHVPKIISEFQKDQDYKNKNIIIVAEIKDLPDMSEDNVDMISVYLIKRDFIKVESLKFANIESASIAIIVSDTTGDRKDYDADARTVLAALTIEKLNPKIYTCAELVHPENETQLAMSGVQSIVLSSNIAAHMMTQAALKASIIPFYNELLCPDEGNYLYEVKVPSEHVGKSFDEVFPDWRKTHKAILVGVMKKDGRVIVNPDKYEFADGDKAVLISTEKPKLK